MRRHLGFHAHCVGDQVVLGPQGQGLVQLLEFGCQSNGLSSRRGLLIKRLLLTWIGSIGTKSAVELQRLQVRLVPPSSSPMGRLDGLQQVCNVCFNILETELKIMKKKFSLPLTLLQLPQFLAGYLCPHWRA